MSYNYKLGNFKNIATETDTDIKERMTTINLSHVKELPTSIVQRLEIMINNMIEKHEQEHNIIIPIENVELGIFLTVDTQEGKMFLDSYIAYSVDEECITGREIISVEDGDYSTFKKYFLTELNHCVFIQLRKIENCF
ncbi:MAG: hypothetical protein IJN64_14130 [Lachnospiraceae bacterium]|nr:hypothetical protein [Lachnospiraceae bacterium]